jgi:hypothetical protein
VKFSISDVVTEVFGGRDERGARGPGDTDDASPVSVEAAPRSSAAPGAHNRVAAAQDGAGAENAENAKSAESAGNVVDYLGGSLDGDAILVKGSRVAGTERVASMLRTAGETRS